MAPVVLGPFSIGFGNTVQGRDPAHPEQEKTACQAYGYSEEEARRMAHAICDALNSMTYAGPKSHWSDDAAAPDISWAVDGIPNDT